LVFQHFQFVFSTNPKLIYHAYQPTIQNSIALKILHKQLKDFYLKFVAYVYLLEEQNQTL